jgi:hypothetical protein
MMLNFEDLELHKLGDGARKTSASRPRGGRAVLARWNTELDERVMARGAWRPGAGSSELGQRAMAASLAPSRRSGTRYVRFRKGLASSGSETLKAQARYIIFSARKVSPSSGSETLESDIGDRQSTSKHTPMSFS